MMLMSPWDGSYDLTDPQSFNRYAYTENDPVNFIDPTGLDTALRIWGFGRIKRILDGMLLSGRPVAGVRAS